MPYKDKEKQRLNNEKWRSLNRGRTASKKRDLRLANPERYKGYVASFRKGRRQALADYKMERGCSICGYKGHPDALHFDHLPGSDKKGQVSYMFASKWDDVLREIEKCQVLCANCHAIETAARRREAKAARKANECQTTLQLG